MLAGAWIGLWVIHSGCGGGSSDARTTAGSPTIDGGDASQGGGSGGSGTGGNSGSASHVDATSAGGSSGSVGAAGDGGSSGSTGGSAGTTGSDGSIGSGGSIDRDSGNCTPIDAGRCRPTPYPTRRDPLDIYIMFDQTGSTCVCLDPGDADTACPPAGCTKTRLDALREAATAFLQDPASSGIGVGIGYFGHLQVGQASCEPADYDDPAVGIAALPGNAAAIIQSMNSVRPTGETPTGPAIRGACSYTRRWKTAHPDHEAVILLLTDGKPEAAVTCPLTGCCPTLADAVAAANECITGNPAVRTYVLGVGPLLSDLQQLAAAGGTRRVYLVESSSVVQEVLDALRVIRSSASRCELGLPKTADGQVVDSKTLNLQLETSPCQYRSIPRVGSVGDCGGAAGWFYDDPVQPTRVVLCPASCDQLSDPQARLTFSAGCAGTPDSG